MKKIHDSETPAHGKQAITACAFIYNHIDGKTKVFLPKRAETKKFLPGVFELPGGHIDFGEKLQQGLQREIFEEFGMNISVGDPFYAFTYTNPIKGSHSVEIVFFAQFLEPIENIRLNPEDHETYDWFTENEVHLAFTDNKQGEDDEWKAIKKGFLLLKTIS